MTKFATIHFVSFLLVWFAAQACHKPKHPSIVYIHFTQNVWEEDRPWILKKESSYRSVAVPVETAGLLTRIGNVQSPQNFQYSLPGHERRRPISLIHFDATTGLGLFEVPEELKFLRAYKVDQQDRLDFETELSIETMNDRGLANRQDIKINDSVLFSSGNNQYPLPHLKSPDVSLTILDGEPILRKGLLTGMVSHSYQKETYILPSFFIRRFLASVKNQETPNFTTLGCSFQALTESAEKKHFHLDPQTDTGSLIIDCPQMQSFESSKKLQTEDVVLKLNNHVINDDLKAMTIWGKLPMRALLSTISPDQGLRAQILRDKKLMEIDLGKELVFRDEYRFIPNNPPLEQNHYLIIAGMVLQDLTGEYFNRFSSPRENSAPTALYTKYLYDNIYQGHDEQRIVFLSDLLTDRINLGQRRDEHQILKTVNKIPIHSIKHLQKVLSENQSEFLDFEFILPTDRKIFKVADLEQANASLLKKYKIPKTALVFPIVAEDSSSPLNDSL